MCLLHRQRFSPLRRGSFRKISVLETHLTRRVSGRRFRSYCFRMFERPDRFVCTPGSFRVRILRALSLVILNLKRGRMVRSVLYGCLTARGSCHLCCCAFVTLRLSQVNGTNINLMGFLFLDRAGGRWEKERISFLFLNGKPLRWPRIFGPHQSKRNGNIPSGVLKNC